MIHLKRLVTLLLIPLFLWGVAGTAGASISEGDFAYVWYEYTVSGEDDQSGFFLDEHVGKDLHDFGTVEVNSRLSFFAPESNYARAELVHKDVDYAKGAGVQIDVDPWAHPESFSGGTGWADAYAEIYFSKEFEITASGYAALGFSLDGWLEASGAAEANWSYVAADNFDSFFEDRDSITNASMDVDIQELFTYSFSEDDIGEILSVGFLLQIYAGFTGEDGGMTGRAMADFMDTMSIDFISGGLANAGGDEVPVHPTPVPAAAWLLLSGLLSLIGLRNKIG